MTKEKMTAGLMAAIQGLFTTYTPQEIEDVLFTAFSRANENSDGDFEDVRCSREHIHTELRRMLRTIGNNMDYFKEISQQWMQQTKENTTEIT